MLELAPFDQQDKIIWRDCKKQGSSNNRFASPSSLLLTPE